MLPDLSVHTFPSRWTSGLSHDPNMVSFSLLKQIPLDYGPKYLSIYLSVCLSVCHNIVVIPSIHRCLYILDISVILYTCKIFELKMTYIYLYFNSISLYSYSNGNSKSVLYLSAKELYLEQKV